MDRQEIACPHCGSIIDVSEILTHQLEEEIEKSYKERYDSKFNELDKKTITLQAEAKRLQAEKATLKEQIDSEVLDKLRAEKQRIRDEESRRITSEKQEELRALQEELTKRTQESKDLSKTRIELERIKREKESIEDTLRAEAEQRLSKELADAKTKWAREHDQQSENRVQEKQYIIEQLQTQINEMKRKAEQGSMQIQGEVQELAIEEWLASNFPFDHISEVKKGVRGGDCVQTVNTRERQNCGTIYYESKRTKAFASDWIDKFKSDMRAKNATLGVIVTETMPKDMERLGLRDGVWVCTFEEFKGLCFVLRESIIMMSSALTSQENKGDKMHMLYDYMTGNEFKEQVKAIVEGFVQMQQDLDQERRAMEGIWKRREKQIQKVVLNTNHMYQSIKGIAGTAIESIPALELPE